MINWKTVLEYAFTSSFENVCTRKGRKRYVDTQVKYAKIDILSVSLIQWAGPPKHFTPKTFTYEEETTADVYEWQGTLGQKMAVLIIEEGDFVGIIDRGDSMLYVGNVGSHPIVATDDIIFLNSDGSTFMSFPKELLTQSGDIVSQFIVKTGWKFINEQIH